jgi:hypothetical protein
MVTKLSKRDERFAKLRLNAGGWSGSSERDGKMGEVQCSSVRRLHDVAVGYADAESVGSGGFVVTGGAASDEGAGAARIENSFFGNRGN